MPREKKNAMTRGWECGEISLGHEILEKKSSLDGMAAKQVNFDGKADEHWEKMSRKQDALRELFTKIYVVLLACSIALFGSALLLLRSTSPETELASSLTARSAAPLDATTTTTMSSLTISSSTSSASSSSTTPVEIFQVFSPVLDTTGLVGSNGPVANTTATESSSSSCQVILMEHSFSDSFGKPFVGMLDYEHCLDGKTLIRSRKLHPARMHEWR